VALAPHGSLLVWELGRGHVMDSGFPVIVLVSIYAAGGAAAEARHQLELARRGLGGLPDPKLCVLVLVCLCRCLPTAEAGPGSITGGAGAAGLLPRAHRGTVRPSISACVRPSGCVSEHAGRLSVRLRVFLPQSVHVAACETSCAACAC
jgi:hypothetical protein